MLLGKVSTMPPKSTKSSTTRPRILNPKTGNMIYADVGLGKKLLEEQKRTTSTRSPTKKTTSARSSSKKTTSTRSPTKKVILTVKTDTFREILHNLKDNIAAKCSTNYDSIIVDHLPYYYYLHANHNKYIASLTSGFPDVDMTPKEDVFIYFGICLKSGGELVVKGFNTYMDHAIHSNDKGLADFMKNIGTYYTMSKVDTKGSGTLTLKRNSKTMLKK